MWEEFWGEVGVRNNVCVSLACCLSQGEEWREEWGGGGVGKDSASRKMDLLRGRGRPGWEGSGNSLGDRVSQSLSSELGEGEGNRFGDDGVSELHTGVSVESDGSKDSLI